MTNENDRKATGNAGANSDEVEQRDTSGEEVPPDPVLSRLGNRHAAGADTPAGPNPNATTDKAKREREKQKAIVQRDEERLSEEESEDSA